MPSQTDNKIRARTKSLCPVCLAVLNATVIERSGKMFLEKTCPVHGSFSIVHPLDIPEQYEKMAGVFRLSSAGFVKPRDLIVYITDVCNQQCPVCYNRTSCSQGSSLTLPQIIDVLKDFSGEYVHLSGGEPTMRDDLPDIIREIKKKGFRVGVFSNGKKLADGSYTGSLKKAGVDLIILQFDSLRDEDYIRIRGESLLSIKLKAIDNLRQSRIPVYLFSVLIEGVNLDQIKPLFRFAAANADIVKILNFNPLWEIGACGDFKRVSNTVIFNEIEEQLGLNLKDFIACTELSHYAFEIYARIRRLKNEDWVRQPPCAQRLYCARMGEKVVSLSSFCDVDGLIKRLREVLDRIGLSSNGLSLLLRCIPFVIFRGGLVNKKGLRLCGALVFAVYRQTIQRLQGKKAPVWTYLDIFSLMVGVFHSKHDIDLGVVSKCTLYANTSGSSKILPACLRQIYVDHEARSVSETIKKIQ